MNITITVNTNDDSEIDEAITFLNKLKTKEEQPKEDNKKPSSILTGYPDYYRKDVFMSLIQSAILEIQTWKADQPLPDIGHWDVSGNTIIARNKYGLFVIAQYNDVDRFITMITEDRDNPTPCCDIVTNGSTLSIALYNLKYEYDKLFS